MRVRRTMLAISTAFVVSSSDMSSSCACGIGSSSEHSEQITQSLHAQDACMARFGGVSALEALLTALASANLMTVGYVFPGTALYLKTHDVHVFQSTVKTTSS